MSSRALPMIRRTKLLSSSAFAAIATLAWAPPAAAQLLGTPTVVGGSADITDPSNITDITPRTIINWGGAPTVALPAANTVNYSGTADYIVLNRILPTDGSQAVQLNGTVNSSVGGAGGQGQVWFYSPSGIVAGAGSRFNVGSLLLTANDVADGDFLDGDNSFTFSRGDSNASVEIRAGAEINAGIGRTSDNYVALIAPRVRQSGSVTVAGGAAYVAAEQVDVTIAGSLFDISFQNGGRGTGATGATADDAAIVHDGSTTVENNDFGYGGPTPGPRNVIMAAVPKNDAVTMLVGGSIAYDAAASAAVVENKIILSGGFDVTADVANGTNAIGFTQRGDAAAAIRIGDTLGAVDLGMDVIGQASGDAGVYATTAPATLSGSLELASLGGNAVIEAARNLTIDGEVSLIAARRASILAEGASTTISINGDLLLSSSGTSNTADDYAGITAQTGAQVILDGNVSLVSTLNPTGDSALSARRAFLLATGGGGISVDGDTTINTRMESNTIAQTRGGAASITTRDAGSTITLNGDTTIDTSATSAGGAGAAAAGGSVTIASSGGLTVGELTVDAGGRGGDGDDGGDEIPGGGFSVAQPGGEGRGGDVTLTLAGTNQFDSLDIDSSGSGGAGGTGNGNANGGAGTGGNIRVDVTGGVTNVIGAANLDAGGRGGSGQTDGIGRGSLAEIRAGAGATLNLGSASLYSQGSGSEGRGGTTRIIANGGQIETGYGVFLDAAGYGEGRSGNGFGGSATLEAASGGRLSITDNVILYADSEGANDFGGSGGAASGDGQGGRTGLLASSGGDIAIGGGAFLYSYARGGSSLARGGIGRGGTMDVWADGGTIAIGGNISLDGGGAAGSSFDEGYGTTTRGAGVGGIATIRVSQAEAPGALSVNGDVDVYLGGNALGGEGSGFFGLMATPGSAGSGTGGTFNLLVDGSFSATEIIADISGIGTDGSNNFSGSGGAGGDGHGGTANIRFSRAAGETVTLSGIDIDARGIAGEGGSGTTGGVGGNGVGGNVTIDFASGTNQIGDIVVDAGGFGGRGGFADRDGGAGGNGTGGNVTVRSQGGTTTVDNLLVSLVGVGGSGSRGQDFGSGIGTGGAGGDGTGGNLELSTTGGTLQLSQVFYGNGGNGFGGEGGDGGDVGYGSPVAGGNGGRGGNGTGGGILISATDGLLRIGDGSTLSLSSTGVGGIGGFGGFGNGGEGAEGANGSGQGGAITIAVAGSGAIRSGAGDILSLDLASLGSTGFSGEGSAGDGATAGGPILISAAASNGTRADAQFGDASLRSGGLNDNNATAGQIRINTVNSDISFGTVEISLLGAGGAALGVPASGLSADRGRIGATGQLTVNTQGDFYVNAANGGTTEAQSGFNANIGGLFSSAGTNSGGTPTLNASYIFVTAGDIETTGDSLLSSDSSIVLRSEDSIRANALRAGAGIFLSGSEGPVPGVITLGSATAGSEIFATANGAITAGDLSAGDRITLNSDGAIQVTTARAGDDILATAGGAVSFGSATATGESSGETGYGETDGSNIRLAGTTVRLDNGDAVDGIFLTATSGAVNSAGLLRAATLDISAVSEIALNDLDIIDAISLGTTGGSITGGDFTTGNFIDLSARDDVRIGSATAQGFVSISAGGTASADALTSGGIFVQGATVDIGTARATNFLQLSATGLVTLDDGEAASFFASGGNVDIGSITTTGTSLSGEGSSGLVIQSAGRTTVQNASSASFVSIDTGTLDAGTIAAAGDVTVSAGGNIAITDVTAGRDVLLDSGGAISVGSAQAGDDIEATATGAISFGRAVTTGLGEDIGEYGYGEGGYGEGGYGEGGYGEGDGSNIRLAGSTVRLDNGDAVDGVYLTAGTGAVNSAGLIRAGTLEISAPTDIALNDLDIRSAIDLATTGGSITGGDFISGGDVLLDASGTVRIGSATATGDVIATAGGAVGIDSAAGRDIRLTGATVRLDDGEAARGISLAAATGAVTSSGLLRAQTLDVTAATDIALNDATIAQAIALTTTGGSISGNSFSTNGDLTLDSAGGITLTSASTGGAAGFTAAGDVTLGSIDSGGGITAQGANITLQQADAGGTVRLNADDDIIVGTIVARGDFLADAGGDFRGTSVTTLPSESGYGEGGQSSAGSRIGALAANPDGNGISIATGGDIRLDTGNSAGAILLDAGGAVAAGRLVSTGDLDASGAAGVTIATIDAGGDVGLTAQNGAVAVTDDLRAAGSVDALGRSVTLNARNDLAVRSARATAGDVRLNAGNNLRVGNADASAAFIANAGNLLSFTGTTNASEITLASRDIAIGENARIGSTERTRSIAITANGGDAPVILGGSAGGSGYRLDNGEFGRLAARDISFAGSGGGITIEALDIRGANASDPNVTGTLSIRDAGDIELTGAVRFNDASDDNVLAIDAGERFFLDTASGSVWITNGNALAGTFDVQARTILMSSRAAAADLADATTIDARSDRLGRNDGPVNLDGYVRAGAIRLGASDGIYIQNSGANSDDPNDRAGLTAGEGGITLINRGEGPLEVILNGRQVTASGTYTGAALIERLILGGETPASLFFAQGSTVNGCLIGGGDCGPPPPEPEFPTIIIPIQDVIDRVLDDEDDSDDALTRPPSPTNELIRVAGYPFAPVIDEPVTGAGNDDLWSTTMPGGFDPGLPDDTIDAQVTGSGNDTLINDQTGGPPNPPVSDAPVTGAGNDTGPITQP